MSPWTHQSLTARADKLCLYLRMFNRPHSAGKHVSARDGGDATVALASYLEGSSLVRPPLDELKRCTNQTNT